MRSLAELSSMVKSLRAGEVLRVIGGGNSELAWVERPTPGQKTVSLSPADPDFGAFEVLQTGLPSGNALVRAGCEPRHGWLVAHVPGAQPARISYRLGTPLTWFSQLLRGALVRRVCREGVLC